MHANVVRALAIATLFVLTYGCADATSEPEPAAEGEPLHVACGDGRCSVHESCSSCPRDCGACGTDAGLSPDSGGEAGAFDAGTPTYTVPSTIASDCSADVTAKLASWIASVPDHATLLFGSNACYRIDGTLTLTDRAGLTLDGNGSVFDGSAPSTDGNRAHWRLVGG